MASPHRQDFKAQHNSNIHNYTISFAPGHHIQITGVSDETVTRALSVASQPVAPSRVNSSTPVMPGTSSGNRQNQDSLPDYGNRNVKNSTKMAQNSDIKSKPPATIKPKDSSLFKDNFDIYIEKPDVKQASPVSGLSIESIPIERVYQPFMNEEFFNEVDRIRKEKKVFLSLPSSSVDKICIAGQEGAVSEAKDQILVLYEHLKSLHAYISVVIPQKLHKNLKGEHGNTAQDVLEKFGVSLEIPSLESSSDIIKIYGPPKKLEKALTYVFSQAISLECAYLKAPNFLHKYIQDIVENTPMSKDFVGVDLNFVDGGIQLKGPDLKNACKTINNMVADLEKIFSLEYVKQSGIFDKYLDETVNNNSPSRVNSSTPVMPGTSSGNRQNQDSLPDYGNRNVKNSTKMAQNSVSSLSICLFCNQDDITSEDIWDHLKHAHGFNFHDLVLSYNLDVLQQCCLINFIREKIINNVCYSCEEEFTTAKLLRKHFKSTRHNRIIPKKEIWDSNRYLISPLTKDPLLVLICDESL